MADRFTWLQLALCKSVVMRALKTACVVGPILIVINHGDAILGGQVEASHVAKMALTFLVPYSVSTVSAVGALMRAGIHHPNQIC